MNSLVAACFNILGIENGWIFAEIKTDQEEVALSNSYLGGTQAPQVLLNTLIDLIDSSKQIETKWICWHGENNSYIWKLVSNGIVLHIHIYEGDSSFGYPLQGDSLAAKVKFTDCLFDVKTSLQLFALSVCNAFKEFSYGDKSCLWESEKYPFEFPRNEYQILRRRLRSQGYQ